MLHEVFKDIFADLLGLGRRGTAQWTTAARHVPAVFHLHEDWSAPVAPHRCDDPLDGIHNHTHDGVASDIYGNPV
jgi:hypothetical protein